jgi:hypothetical protein
VKCPFQVAVSTEYIPKRKVSNFTIDNGSDIQLFTTIILKARVIIYFLTLLDVRSNLFYYYRIYYLKLVKFLYLNKAFYLYSVFFFRGLTLLKKIDCLAITKPGNPDVKVKQSHYRPGKTLRASGERESQISRQSTHVDGKAVSLTHRLPLPLGNTSGTHFYYSLSRPQGHSAGGRIMSNKTSNDTIKNRNRELPVCSAVPESPRDRKTGCDRINNKRDNVYHPYKFLTKLGCFLIRNNQYNLSGS